MQDNSSLFLESESRVLSRMGISDRYQVLYHVLLDLVAEYSIIPYSTLDTLFREHNMTTWNKVLAAVLVLATTVASSASDPSVYVSSAIEYEEAEAEGEHIPQHGREQGQRRLQPTTWEYPMQPSQLERPINILAFGGSVTWGSTLDDRNQAFPSLMGAPHHVDHVDNMAMRATGADYPSLCLQSIIPDAENNPKNYDVILFDFVLNGTDGFPLLLRRLKARYPDAVIIYVHIWSIVNLALEVGTSQPPKPKAIGFDPHYRKWEWKKGDTFNPGSANCAREVCGKEQMEKLVTDAGGHIWHMPRPDTVMEVVDKGWFSSDWHHLSAHGHQFIANNLLAYLQTVTQDVFKPKRLGTFGMGDQCWNWFESGDVQLDYVNAEPKNMLRDGMKVTLEIDPKTAPQGGSLGFDSQFDIPVPVGLAYMSIRDPPDYPKVEVKVNSIFSAGVSIDPAYNNNTPSVHIVVFAHVGWVLPGRNIITITPLEHSKTNPFRVVGVFLCGECAKMGDLGSGAVNSPAYSGPLEEFILKRVESEASV
jgi:hypothetical protein